MTLICFYVTLVNLQILEFKYLFSYVVIGINMYSSFKDRWESL